MKVEIFATFTTRLFRRKKQHRVKKFLECRMTDARQSSFNTKVVNGT